MINTEQKPGLFARFADRRRTKRENQIREFVLREINDRGSMIFAMFNVFVVAEVERRLRDVLRGRRIAHCHVCLASDQLFNVGEGRMACKTHAVSR